MSNNNEVVKDQVVDMNDLKDSVLDRFDPGSAKQKITFDKERIVDLSDPNYVHDETVEFGLVVNPKYSQRDNYQFCIAGFEINDNGRNVWVSTSIEDPSIAKGLIRTDPKTKKVQYNYNNSWRDVVKGTPTVMKTGKVLFEYKDSIWKAELKS